MNGTSPSRQLAYLPLDEIRRAARNPKEHDLDGIRASIRDFGCVLAGVVDDRTGVLIAGHGRLEVLTRLREEGAPPPEGVQTDETGRWLVPLLRGWSSRSDVHADAYLIADNRLTERGGWDDRMLAEVLDEITDHDPDLLDATGYTQQDLDDILALINIDGTPKDGSGGRGLYDEPDDSAFAPEIRIRVTPDVFDRWRSVLDRYPGKDDVAKLARLLDDLGADGSGWDGT